MIRSDSINKIISSVSSYKKYALFNSQYEDVMFRIKEHLLFGKHLFSGQKHKKTFKECSIIFKSKHQKITTLLHDIKVMFSIQNERIDFLLMTVFFFVHYAVY